jgi:hypothetical protein
VLVYLACVDSGEKLCAEILSDKVMDIIRLW